MGRHKRGHPKAPAPSDSHILLLSAPRSGAGLHKGPVGGGGQSLCRKANLVSMPTVGMPRVLSPPASQSLGTLGAPCRRTETRVLHRNWRTRVRGGTGAGTEEQGPGWVCRARPLDSEAAPGDRAGKTVTTTAKDSGQDTNSEGDAAAGPEG